MTAPRPVRLQLSRRKGFDLQAHSRAVNGLPEVSVARPGKWGNPFVIHPNQKPGRSWSDSYFSVPTADEAVACYRLLFFEPLDPSPYTRAYILRSSLNELRGKNLACRCKLGDPCHADVLLELANR